MNKDEAFKSIATDDIYTQICECANYLEINTTQKEIADIAYKNNFGKDELDAVKSIFSYLAKRKHENSIETLLRLSRLPQKVPKTFEGFDFSRMQGNGVDALEKLPSLTNLHARKNIAFIGPGGIGKTHLAQAYGRQCCMQGFKTYYLKASELNDRLKRASLALISPTRLSNALVKPSCLIIDELGRCVFDKECTNLFFDIVDRRYEKECPNTLILTSNTPVNNWDQFFTGDDTLLCALDRIFDKASVFVMKGASFRGTECKTYSVEAMPTVARLNN